MRHAHQPLRVAEAHSETAYTTNHATEFFLEPWPYTMVSSFVLHQNFGIKLPHTHTINYFWILKYHQQLDPVIN